MTRCEYKNKKDAITQNKMPPLRGSLAHPVLKNLEVIQFWWGPQ
jgi:hypothetical protein